VKKHREVRIGISGWHYPGWRGVFYPKGLPQRRELEFASRALNSIEINGSFYPLQRPESYQRWRKETPKDFLFSVKGGRFITHMKKLRDCQPKDAKLVSSKKATPQVRDVFVYFDNDAKVHAPFDAKQRARWLGITCEKH